MTEVVSYEGEYGLRAILRGLDNVRRMLAASAVDAEQAAGYLGCINLHLAHILGVHGELREQLQECGGLLCPNCKGYIGLLSDLSGDCHLCGEKLFPFFDNRPEPKLDKVAT